MLASFFCCTWTGRLDGLLCPCFAICFHLRLLQYPLESQHNCVAKAMHSYGYGNHLFFLSSLFISFIGFSVPCWNTQAQEQTRPSTLLSAAFTCSEPPTARQIGTHRLRLLLSSFFLAISLRVCGSIGLLLLSFTAVGGSNPMVYFRRLKPRKRISAENDDVARERELIQNPVLQTDNNLVINQ